MADPVVPTPHLHSHADHRYGRISFWLTLGWIIGNLLSAIVAAGLAGHQDDSVSGAHIVVNAMWASAVVLSVYLLVTHAARAIMARCGVHPSPEAK